MKSDLELADEHEYLKWFYMNVDFGPSDSDVRYFMNKRFERETGKSVPKGYSEDE